MATYGSKLRKYRASHAAAGGRAKREVELQGRYISTYDTFSAYAAGTKTPGNLKLFRPEQRKQRTGYTAAQRKAYEPYMAMEWYRPEDIIASKGGAISHRGTSNFRLDKFIRYQAASNRPTKGWFQSIANQYKGKALAAEMGELEKAKARLSGWESTPFDTSHISSARKGQRNAAAASTQTKARKAEVAAATAAASRASGPASNYEWRSVGYTDAEIKNNANTDFKKFEYVLKTDQAPIYSGIDTGIDNFFGTKRDEKGRVVKHKASNYLKSEDIAWMKNTTNDYINSGLASSIPIQMQHQQREEDSLEIELSRINDQLKQHEIKGKEKNDTQLYNPSNDFYALSDKKQEIQSKLQAINNDQLVIAQALQSTDYNTMMIYLQKNDVNTEKEAKYLSTKKPSLKALEQEQAMTSWQHDQAKTMTSAIASDIRHLKHLEKNNFDGRKQDEIDNFVLGLDNRYENLITMVDTNADTTHKGVSKGDTSSVKGILAQLKRNELVPQQKEQSKIRKKQLDNALALSKQLTSEQRLGRAQQINKVVEDKREFENLTGMKAGNDAGKSMDDWLDSIGETRADKRMKGYVNRDVNTDWFSSWLNNDIMFNKDDDLTLYGYVDDKKKQALQGKADILNKYDAWGSANQFIGAQLTEYKHDLGQYYRAYHSTPNVTKQQVSRGWFGSPTIEGDSFVGYVNQEMGGIRGGEYWIGDVKKLNKKTKEYEGTLQQQIEDKKLQVEKLKLKQSELSESHAALRPTIDSAVESGVKHGNITVNDALIKKLGSSSQSLYDMNYNVASLETEQEYLEKSLVKTTKEREQLEKQRKKREYNQLHNSGGGNITNYRSKSSPGRPSLKSFSRRNDGGGGQQKTRGGKNTLGGLVV